MVIETEPETVTETGYFSRKGPIKKKIGHGLGLGHGLDNILDNH
jgi:hypothetical protein